MKVGWNPNFLVFGIVGVISAIFSCLALYLWIIDIHKFNWFSFKIGFVGSVLNTVGLALLANSFQCGPSCPITGTISISYMLFIIID